MKVLILGVNGFIGNALANELIKKKGVIIYGLDVNSDNIQWQSSRIFVYS